MSSKLLDAIDLNDLAAVDRLSKKSKTISKSKVALLLRAVRAGCSKEVVELLLKRGAKLEVRDNLDEGWNALLYACYIGNVELASVLIKSGASVKAQLPASNTGASCLHLCCMSFDGDDDAVTNRRHAIAKLLIKNGANLNKQRGENGWTPLMEASSFGLVDIVRTLVEAGADLDMLNSEKENALNVAIHCFEEGKSTKHDVAAAIINGGADLNVLQSENWTVLMHVCEHGPKETAHLLIQKGAALDIQNDSGWTALMFACRYGQPDTVLLILEKGAAVNIAQPDGWTASHVACAQPNVSTETNHSIADMLQNLKYCYIHGANFSLQTKDGLDVLGVAKAEGRLDAVPFIEYVMNNPVAHTLVQTLDLPRACVVAFFENQLNTLEECKILTEQDLASFGVTSLVKRRTAHQFLAKGILEQPQSSVKRLSQRVSGMLKRLSGRQRKSTGRYDAFLTHDWGENGENHVLVSEINRKLQSYDKVTWFDEDRLSGNVALQITKGLEGSRKVVVFITQRYMLKLMSEGEDYCQKEFLASCRVKGVRNMIPCVMEQRMLDTSSWIGPLQLNLAGELYIDFSTKEKQEENFLALLARIES